MTISDIAKRFGFSESGFTQFLNQQDTIPITNRLFAPSIADEDIPKAINEYKAFLYKAIEEKTVYKQSAFIQDAEKLLAIQDKQSEQAQNQSETEKQQAEENDRAGSDLIPNHSTTTQDKDQTALLKSIQSLCQDVHTISHDVHVLYVLVILSLVLSIIAGIVLVLAFITS